jgi:hypothetical protein
VIAYEALAQSLVARQLQTPIEDAIEVDWSEAPARAARRLAGFDFDQAPARRDGLLVGFVVRRELSSSSEPIVGPLVHLLGPDTLTSASASIREVIEALLPDVGLTFVVDGHRIAGFVTPSDLNKHPARAHFYLLLADLEVSLAGLVRSSFRDQSKALALLPRRSRDFISDRYDSAKEGGFDIDLVAEMDLGHFIKIIGITAEARAQIGSRSEGDWEKRTRGLVKLRNSVMHPSREFVGLTRTLADLVDLESRVHDMLQAASYPTSSPFASGSTSASSSFL